MPGMIKIKLIRSVICTPEKHKVIVRALGLKKMNRIVERPGYAGLSGHGEEDSALAGDCRLRRSN